MLGCRPHINLRFDLTSVKQWGSRQIAFIISSCFIPDFTHTFHSKTEHILAWVTYFFCNAGHLHFNMNLQKSFFIVLKTYINKTCPTCRSISNDLQSTIIYKDKNFSEKSIIFFIFILNKCTWKDLLYFCIQFLCKTVSNKIAI